MQTVAPAFIKLSSEFVEPYKTKQVPWGPLGFVTYKRTYARHLDINDHNSPKEEWWQTLRRCVNGALAIGVGFTKEEAERLYDHIFNLRCCFSGRGLWQLGTKYVERNGQDSLNNCWFVNIDYDRDSKDPSRPFCFLFDELMMGGGVGFSIHPRHVYELPNVQYDVQIIRRDERDVDFIVPDNREGWVELLKRVFDAFFFTGKDFVYSAHCIRGRGSPIRGFGGTASGPVELCRGMDKIAVLLRSRVGRKLRPIDCLDIANICGHVVRAGNVRRSAQVAIGKNTDTEFLWAKNWERGPVPAHRGQSNNSVFCDHIDELSGDFWVGYEGGGEAYGLVNLTNAQRYGRFADGLNYRPDPKVVGGNPCLPGWATLLTPDGMTTMEEVGIGDVIWSGKNWTHITDKACTGEKVVYAHHTRAGVFYGTETHRVVQRGEKVQAKDAESIDLPGTPFAEINISPGSWNPQLVMDGLVLGDGSVHALSRERVYLIIGAKDGDYHDSEIEHLILKHRPGVNPLYWAIQTGISQAELPRTYNRVIPARYRFASLHDVCSFLRGLYSANGSVVSRRITLKASSFPVIEATQEMLASVGIRSYYTVNKAKPVKFANGTFVCKQSYDLNVCIDRRRFRDLIGFLQEYKQDRLEEICESASPGGKESYEIIAREWWSEEKVYDITVEAEEHTYWTGGLLVSNCMEIFLASNEACNLGEIFLPNCSKEQFLDCALLLYKVCKGISCLPATWPESQQIIEEHRRIGIGVAGFLQMPDWHQPEIFTKVYRALEELDRAWSKELGVNQSIKLTTVKPGGTLPLLPGVLAGASPGFAEFQIRRIRFGADDPLVAICRSHGYHIEPEIQLDGSRNLDTMVVDFPIAAPPNAILAGDLTAIQHLEYVAWLQEFWSDNSVSVTVYYRPEELPEIKEWLREHYHKRLKTISFCLHKDHGFAQAPLEEITEAQFKEMSSKVKPITRLDDIGSALIEDLACDKGGCPVR